MADLIKKIKIKKQDGTFTNYIPIGAEAKNISTNDGTSVEYKLNKKPYYFDTVADMKAAEFLKDGDACQTLGYYSINDGGATYIIRNTTPSGYYETLDNGKFAELIVYKNEINVLTFGVKGDGITNDTQNIQKSSNYATAKGYNLYFPNKTYLTDTITIENVKILTIDGEIKLTTNQESINVFENVNGPTPKIFINKVTIGNIIMKGLNSADVTIQSANKLILLADNTPNHNFIGYTTFNLGFIRHLEIKDDGSGTKWINENLFIGGRFLSITIGGDNSTYGHQNNTFFKPLCEHTKINIILGYCNQIIDARLEGDAEITFGEKTIGNVITSNFAETLQGILLPKYYGRLSTRYTDLSNGKNKVINNSEINEINVISLNKFNNPKNITIEGDYLKPTTNQTMYETDYIEIPKTIFMLFLKLDNPRLNWRIRCYDENKEIVSSPNLTINSPTIGLVASGVYGNTTYDRDNYWAIFNPENTSVKYIKMLINSTPSYSDELFKNINLIFTSYNNYTDYQYFIDGLKKCI